MNLAELPTVDLGGLVVYDAFVMRGLWENDVIIPQFETNNIAYHVFGQTINSNPSALAIESEIANAIAKEIWQLFIQEPSVPPVEDRDYVAGVWRYLLVPSALVSVSTCLDYWSDRNKRNLSWSTINGRPVGYGSHYPTVHAEEYVRSKQVLFEALGDEEGGKYAEALASKVNPKKWVKQLRKRERLTQPKMSNLGFSYDGLLREPFTVNDNDKRLVVWLLDNHFRHPKGPYLPYKREPTFIDFGAACATTYALLLTVLYNDTTGRFAKILETHLATDRFPSPTS